MKKKSKILTLGLGGFVDELINEVGVNKTQIHLRINEELAPRGKSVTWNTVSSYIDNWLAERDKNAADRLAIIPIDQVNPDSEWGMSIVKSISDKYDASVAKSLVSATSLENGIVSAIQFYSAIVTAGLARVLNDPDSVSLQDALKAADLLDKARSGKGSMAKTVLSQAIQINTSGNVDVKEVELIDDEILFK